MDNIAHHISPDPLDIISRKLDDLMATTSALQQRQVTDDEFQLELVKFLSSTAQLQQDQINELATAVQRNSDDIRMLCSHIGEMQKSYFEAIEKKSAAVIAEVKANTNARAQSLFRLTAMGIRKSRPLGDRIRCIFLVHSIETWDALADLHEAMLLDDRFTPIVATINRRYPGQNGFGNEDKTSAFLTEMKVKHVRLGMPDAYQGLEIIKTMMPDIIFRQSQWDNDIPPAFSAAELQFSKLCFVPYASTIVTQYTMNENTTDSASNYAYNQPYHQLAWRIYSETRFTAENYRHFHGADPEKVVLAGSSKNERLMKTQGLDVWPISQDGANRYRVVWAPHHSLGTGWLAFGVFHLIFEQMLQWATQRQDIDFVFKPHPALLSTAIEHRFIARDRVEAFDSKWRSLPNCTVCTGQYAELFASSDLLITDGISFLTEYQLFDKPLVYFDSRCHVPFNELGELAEAAAHIVTSFDELQAAVLQYKAGAPWERHEERAQLREAMVPHSKPAANVILDDIAQGLGVYVANQLGFNHA